LCEYFKQHKDIFVPQIKEPRFFVAQTIKNLSQADPFREYLIKSSTLTQEAYEDIYKESELAEYRCDASVQYLYYHEIVIPEIKKYLGDPIILIVLRNPVERAFSNYTYLKKDRQYSFEEAIALETSRQKEGWNSFWFYIGQGYYYEQVKHYMDAFSRVKIVLMDDFNNDANSVLNDIFDFLEVPRINIDAKTMYNKSGVPRNKFVEWIIFNDNFLKKGIRHFINKKYSTSERERLRRNIKNRFLKKSDLTLSVQTHNNLIDLYREDILKLQDMIKRDLTGWLVKK